VPGVASSLQRLDDLDAREVTDLSRKDHRVWGLLADLKEAGEGVGVVDDLESGSQRREEPVFGERSVDQ
jgi:hypothetical protein